MIQEIDPNHDGKITFDEFTAMMGVEGVEQTLEIKDWLFLLGYNLIFVCIWFNVKIIYNYKTTSIWEFYH